MDNKPFIVDGRPVSAEECLRIFSDQELQDRERRCLDWLEGETVVDIGCYSGAFVDAVVKRHPHKQVIGVDYDAENLRIARFLHPEHHFVHSSVYDIGVPDSTVDCVTFQEVIEHLEGAALAIKEINRILKPGGHLILSTPHPYYWRDMAAFFAREAHHRLSTRRHQLRTAVYIPEVEWNRHVHCWTPSTLMTLLSDNGFDYVDHQFSTDARGGVEKAFLKLLPFLGPVQILKVRKTGDAPSGMI